LTGKVSGRGEVRLENRITLSVGNEQKDILENNFSFIECLGVPAGVIDISENTLISFNENLKDALALEKGFGYKLESIFVFGDDITESISACEKSLNHVVLGKTIDGNLLPLLANSQIKECNGKKFILVSFFNNFDKIIVDRSLLLEENIGNYLQKFYKFSSALPWSKDKNIHLNLTTKAFESPELETSIVIDTLANEERVVYSLENGVDLINNLLSNKRTFSVAYVHVEDSEMIKDKFGEDEQKKYLAEMAQIVSNAIRHTDVFVRLQDHEFIVIFPNCTKDVVSNILTTLVNKLNALNVSDIMSYKYSLQAGMTEVSAETHFDVNDIVNNVTSNLTFKTSKTSK